MSSMYEQAYNQYPKSYLKLVLTQKASNEEQVINKHSEYVQEG